jgi:2-hydroxycyclohexanecarboxyl-CoA dehydrogenase
MTKVAIVTGGASGIGLAIAQRLARDGARVAIFDLDADAAGAAAADIGSAGGKATAHRVDVAERAAVDQGVAEVRERLGPVAILVNNAGKEGFTPFLSITEQSWNTLLRVNLTGTFHCCQAVLPDMIEAGWGRIVNISSSSTHSGQPFMSAYVAAKSAVNGLTKSLALEYGPSGITVNAVPPGFIDTPMLRKSAERGYLVIDKNIESTPVRRMGRPEDIAAACAFLISEEAGYITGQILGVNGGRNT